MISSYFSIHPIWPQSTSYQDKDVFLPPLMEIVSKPRKFSVVKLVIGEIFFILHIVYVGVLDILHGMEKTLH